MLLALPGHAAAGEPNGAASADQPKAAPVADALPPSLGDVVEARIAAGPMTSAPAESGTFSLDENGLLFKSADGKSSFKVGGRIQADAIFHSDDKLADTELTDGTEIRRGRIELKGNMDDVIWESAVDFALDRVRIKDMFVGNEFEGGEKLMFGHQKQPYSLDIEMSSNDIPFTERSISAILTVPFVDRAVGARVEVPGERTFFAAGVYGESIREMLPTDEGWGATSRFVFAPVQSENQTVHVGVRGSYRNPQADASFDIGDEVTNASGAGILETATLSVDEALLYGVEAAWARGPFSIYGEYDMAHYEFDGDEADFSGWYVATTYSLTGESRAKAYKGSAGEFKRLSATRPSSSPFAGGAWELAARVSGVDLVDGSVDGGEAIAGNLALNWYSRENVRYMLDWTHILDTDGGGPQTADAEGLDVFTFRIQLVF